MAKHLGVVRGTDDRPMYVPWTTAVLPYPETFITVQSVHTTAVSLCRPLMAGMTSAGVSAARRPAHPGAHVDPMVPRTPFPGSDYSYGMLRQGFIDRTPPVCISWAQGQLNLVQSGSLVVAHGVAALFSLF